MTILCVPFRADPPPRFGSPPPAARAEVGYRGHPRRLISRSAFSLVEVIITMTIIAILVSFATPSLSRSMEQSHADMVGAGLRSISVAQRFYWLENRTYAPDLQTLIDEELIDGNLSAVTPRYEYSIAAASAGAFQAQARRRNLDALGNPVFDGAWRGTFTIDETGVIGGVVQGPVSPLNSESPQLTPAF